MGVIVIMKFTSDFSHYFQSLGHLNVVPTDHQRVIGSPAPAAIRKMNEKHRKKKLVSKSKYGKDTMNCPEKVMKISNFNQNQSAHSIYIKIEICYFSLDQ